MTQGLLVLALSAAAMLPAAAWAEPVFDTFKDVCVATGGETGASLAAAEAKGWKPMSKAMLASFPRMGGKDGPPPTVDGRIDGVPGTLKGAMVIGHTHKVDDDLDIGADFCVVASSVFDVDALKVEMARYAAVPANTDLFKDAATTVYAWRDSSEGRKPATRAELEDASTAKGVKILVAEGQAKFAMVGLFTPTK